MYLKHHNYSSKYKAFTHNFLLNDPGVFIDADSEGWSTAFVKQWLQADFSPTTTPEK